VLRNEKLKWTFRASALQLLLLGRYGLHRHRIIHCATIASSVETLERDGFAGIISWFIFANPKSDPNEIRFVWIGLDKRDSRNLAILSLQKADSITGRVICYRGMIHTVSFNSSISAQLLTTEASKKPSQSTDLLRFEGGVAPID
jgi:hypothetical protein